MKTLSATQIRQANPKGEMGLVSGANCIQFSNVSFLTSCSRETTILWNKLLKMGYKRSYNFQSDEFDGICQAAQLGYNPFEFTIISA